MTDTSDKVRKLRSEGSNNMTICIAAECDSDDGKEPLIVLCTDRLLSSDLGVSESALKERWMPHGFYCLTAGNDDTDLTATTKHILRQLAHLTNPELDDEILVAVKKALYARKNDYAENFTRARFAMSYEEFIDKGREKLPQDIFTQSLLQIRDLRLSCEFIIAGMISNIPLIIQTTQDFDAYIAGPYAAIGSGSYLATAALLHQNYDNIMPLRQAVYCVYEAKKYAERVRSVGEKTIISVLGINEKRKSLNAPTHIALQKMYEALGPKKIPDQVNLPDVIFREPSPAAE